MALMGDGAELVAVAQKWEADASPDELMAAVMWDFAGYLDEKVVTPVDFIMAREWFILDTCTGINSYTREPLSGVLGAFPPGDYDSGYPPEIYGELRRRSLDFARTVFGDAFADEASAFMARLIAATDEMYPNDVPGRRTY